MSATFYFDLGSPYVYLAAERLDRLGLTGVEWQPISLGGLFKLTGRSSWGLSPRRELGMAEIEARTALRMAFTEGHDLSQPEAVLEAARGCGIDPEWVAERIAQQDLKDRLRAGTEAAHARGVFGVPTLAVGERLYWGRRPAGARRELVDPEPVEQRVVGAPAPAHAHGQVEVHLQP